MHSNLFKNTKVWFTWAQTHSNALKHDQRSSEMDQIIHKNSNTLKLVQMHSFCSKVLKCIHKSSMQSLNIVTNLIDCNQALPCDRYMHYCLLGNACSKKCNSHWLMLCNCINHRQYSQSETERDWLKMRSKISAAMVSTGLVVNDRSDVKCQALADDKSDNMNDVDWKNQCIPFGFVHSIQT